VGRGEFVDRVLCDRDVIGLAVLVVIPFRELGTRTVVVGGERPTPHAEGSKLWWGSRGVERRPPAVRGVVALEDLLELRRRQRVVWHVRGGGGLWKLGIAHEAEGPGPGGGGALGDF